MDGFSRIRLSLHLFPDACRNDLPGAQDYFAGNLLFAFGKILIQRSFRRTAFFKDFIQAGGMIALFFHQGAGGFKKFFAVRQHVIFVIFPTKEDKSNMSSGLHIR